MVFERIFGIKDKTKESEEGFRVAFTEKEIAVLKDALTKHIWQIEAHQKTLKSYDREQRKFMDSIVDPHKLEEERRFLKQILRELVPSRRRETGAVTNLEFTRPKLEGILNEVRARISDLGIFQKIPEDIQKVMSPESSELNVSEEAEALIAIQRKVEHLIGKTEESNDNRKDS